MKFPTLIQGKITAQIIVYTIVLFVIIYLIMQVAKALLGFDTFFKWWNTNGGKNYKGAFDMTSFALFQESKLAFNIRQAFIPGQDKLNITDIMLIQSIALNQAKVLTQKDGKTPVDGNFVLPHHLVEGIAWSSADDPVFQNLYSYWLNAASTASPSGKYQDPSYNTGWDWPLKYQGFGDNPIGPEDSTGWTGITGNQCGGFWPHQNGCTGFFDTPGGEGTPYDLLVNPARSSIGELVSITAGTAPMYSYTPALFMGPDPKRGAAGNQVYIYYIPGHPGPRGSWAQLFADFGIIYTESSKSGDSKVPVISDGAMCQGNDGTSPLKPVPQSCNPKTDSSDKSTGMPISDFNIWNESSRWIQTGQNTSSYGPNFFSAFRMDPVSYVFTSWVGNMYDDPTTGIILDPQAIKNLVGMGSPGIRGQNGGWIKFFKGINTDLKSYDEIMNQLFTQYATQFTARAEINNTAKKCGASSIMSAIVGGIGLAFMAIMIPGIGTGAAIALGGSLFAASSFSSAASSGCIPGIKPS